MAEHLCRTSAKFNQNSARQSVLCKINSLHRAHRKSCNHNRDNSISHTYSHAHCRIAFPFLSPTQIHLRRVIVYNGDGSQQCQFTYCYSSSIDYTHLNYTNTDAHTKWERRTRTRTQMHAHYRAYSPSIGKLKEEAKKKKRFTKKKNEDRHRAVVETV